MGAARGTAFLAKRDFYDVLGVERGSDEAGLKSAYRKLAMQFHPDRNPGDHEAEHRFKEINEAYDTLKDPQKRAAYDRFGHAAFENGGGGGGGGVGHDLPPPLSPLFHGPFCTGGAVSFLPSTAPAILFLLSLGGPRTF